MYPPLFVKQTLSEDTTPIFYEVDRHLIKPRGYGSNKNSVRIVITKKQVALRSLGGQKRGYRAASVSRESGA